MPQTDYETRDRDATKYEAALDVFLRTRTITRCPTVCAVPTQATVADHDRAAYRDYVAAREAARLERARSLRQLVHPWSSSPG